MTDDWKFILAATPSMDSPPRQPLVKLGELDQLRGREVDFGLNRSGSGRGTLPLHDPMANEIFIGQPRRATLRRSIIAMRGEDHIWSGPIATVEGSAPEMTMNIAAVGWFEILNFRELSVDLVFNGINPTTSLPWNDTDIAFALLDEANNQYPGKPTPISRGLAIGQRQNRERKYTKGSKIGPLIHELSIIENGFDYEIDPLTRELNIYGAGSGKGADKPEVHFGYYFGPGNLERVSFAEDGFSTLNVMRAYGNQGVQPALAQDLESMSAFGIFEESASLANITDSSLLLAYAGAEVAIRSLPRLTYTILPFPWRADLPIPRFKTDYDIGDRGRFSFNAGAASTYKQHVRFYGATVSVTDENIERITKLEIAPTG